jgi:mRNA deadenylase 3'-5' endonuclease subunit Ccr4
MTTAPLPPKKDIHFRSLTETTAPKENEEPTSTTFSVCNYNVLIQDFVSPERYPSVQNPSLVFDRDRRRKMLVQDVLQLKPHTDIFCFEEMGSETFHDFQAALGDDYSGDLVKRQGDDCPLHNAMFYNKNKFQLENYYDVDLHKGLSKLVLGGGGDDLPLPQDLSQFQNVDFHTICNHFSFLQNGKKKHLLIIMAHFHHDPAHDLIKYAEMSELLNELSRIYNHVHQDVSADDIYTVLTGDLNAQPSNQVYNLIEGKQPTLELLECETMVQPEWLAKRKEWLPLYQQIYETTDTTIVARRLQSVYSLYHGENDDKAKKGEKGHPPYTNLTDTFTNTIDYIFYDVTRLSPIKLLEIDQHFYEQEGYLPSSLHASDHVMLFAEFRCL